MESWERGAAMPSLQRGTHLLDQTAGETGLESDPPFFFPSHHFHYFITVGKWCFIKWTSWAQRNVQISMNNVAASLPPALLSWIPFFCYFWLPFFHLSPQTYQYSMATISVFPKSTYYSPVILPRSLFKPWLLYSLLINIAFTFMPVFAITAIVFKEHWEGTQVKPQNLDILGIRNGPEFWGLGSCFVIISYEYSNCTRQCLDLFTSFYTHHSAALARLKPININLQ